MHTLRAPALQRLILLKFYETICEIIISKTVCGIFLIFCRSSFIDNFIVKKNFSEPYNYRNLNISRPIYLKKIPHTVLKIISAQISWKKFFFEKKLFQGLGAFFVIAKPLTWVSFFSTKYKFYTFFKCDYLILI